MKYHVFVAAQKWRISTMKRKRKLSEDSVRVIKISKDALFEFIYENFIDEQDTYFDVDPLAVTGTWAVDLARGEFIFCVYKAEDEEGNLIKLPEEIDLGQLMKNIPDTTVSMFNDGRYKEYTKAELIEASKGADQRDG